MQRKHRRGKRIYMRKDTQFLIIAAIIVAAALFWLLFQTYYPGSSGKNSQEEKQMLEKKYGAKPYTGKKLILTDEEWKERLTPEQYFVMRGNGTEAAYSDKKLLDNKQPGIYACSACQLSLFSSETKFHSGTGWPSFWAPIDPSHVGYSLDRKFFTTRVEVHCNRCDSHSGPCL